MMKYAAFLRGINVSGQKLIKMTDLAMYFKDMGFANISTYIQSGNVLFETSENQTTLEKKIEAGLKESLGYNVPVIVRSISQLKGLVKNTPFKGVEPDKTVSIYIGFLANAPSKDNVQKLLTFANDLEKFVVKDKNVYVLNYRGKGKLVFSNAFLEKKLAVTATTRNWNTLRKLAG